MEKRTLDIPILWPQCFAQCDHCLDRLRLALEALDGMQSVTVDPDKPAVHVVYDPRNLTFEHISDFAEACGVRLSRQFHHETVALFGLDCPDCAMKLESAIRKMKGVSWASVNYASSELAVEFDPNETGIEKITRRVRGMGYDVAAAAETTHDEDSRLLRRKLRAAATATAGFLLLMGLGVRHVLDQPVTDNAFFVASAFFGGLYAARASYYSVRSLSLDMNVLVTTAAAGAIVLGDYCESAAVLFLFSLGSVLEAMAVERTRKSVKSLITSVPRTVTVRRDGQWQSVEAVGVEIGETALIRPGENSPVDGTVISGESDVNEALVTGESKPVAKRSGDSVYAGSINGTASLEVRITNRAEDNTVARIVRLAEEAQSQKAPSQRFSEAFGRVYTPCVLALAVLLAALAPTFSHEPHTNWITRSLTLLVVSCPCALVISTPVAVIAAIGNAARNGILIKGGAYLEALGATNVFAFDKTGTLTTGAPNVCEVIAFDSYTTQEIIEIAAAVEQRSEHPLASAVTNLARSQSTAERSVHYFEAIPGKGARAVLDNGLFAVGNKRLLNDMGIQTPDDPRLTVLTEQGYTVVWITNESSCLGALALADTIRDSAKPTVCALRQAGIEKVILLTGDNDAAGRAVAVELGLDEAFTNLLPSDKMAQVRELRSTHSRVAMVGDGINDAPALAAADVGIAMGGAGSEAAIEAADVALMADDILMLPYAVRLSRRSRAIIAQNVVFALSVVVLLTAAALTEKIGLAMGVLAHEGSALLVIGNSMRLFRHVD